MTIYSKFEYLSTTSSHSLSLPIRRRMNSYSLFMSAVVFLYSQKLIKIHVTTALPTSHPRPNPTTTLSLPEAVFGTEFLGYFTPEPIFFQKIPTKLKKPNDSSKIKELNIFSSNTILVNRNHFGFPTNAFRFYTRRKTETPPK